MSGLRAHLRVRRGDLDLDLELDVEPGRVVALMGPNGAGKTTALHVLAGLLALEDGCVRLGGRVLDEPSSRTFVPPPGREAALVFQDHVLFGHLSALENVAFGPRARGAGRAHARTLARDALEQLDVAHLAARRPHQLSGGQAQRVSLARALAAAPRLLLLDEPFSSLDAGTRLDVRSRLRAHLRAGSTCTVLVAHDVLDAHVLADTVVVVEDGSVVQVGTPEEVTRAPRSRYVARLSGLNLVHGHAAGDLVTTGGGSVLRVTGAPDGAVAVSFAPDAVVLHRQRPVSTSAGTWCGTVTSVEPSPAGALRVRLSGDPEVVADVDHVAVRDLDLRPGATLWASLEADRTRVDPVGNAVRARPMEPQAP